MSRAKGLTRTEPTVKRGALVEVREEGIRPWIGRVLSLKWSPVSGWWLEVLNDEGGAWCIQEADARELGPLEAAGHELKVEVA